MSVPATPVLAWIDTETSGLRADVDQLLQVACILTDPQLRVIVEEPFESVIATANVPSLRDRVDPTVRDMHDRTGLWQRCADPDAPPLKHVEQALLDYIRAAAPERRQARLAGNSIRHDLNFLDAHMPSVAEHLHYRSVDVSAIAFIAEHNLDYAPVATASNHEALSDLHDSIHQLHAVLQQARTAGAGR